MCDNYTELELENGIDFEGNRVDLALDVGVVLEPKKSVYGSLYTGYAIIVEILNEDNFRIVTDYGNTVKLGKNEINQMYSTLKKDNLKDHFDRQLQLLNDVYTTYCLD